MGKIVDLFNEITLPQQIRTQVLVADKLFSESESRVEDLKSQLLRKEAEVNPALRENERLKQQIEHLASSEKNNLTFNQTTGTHVDIAGVHYCTKCLDEDKRRQLRNDDHGWTCMVCGKPYNDPNRPWPTVPAYQNPFDV